MNDRKLTEEEQKLVNASSVIEVQERDDDLRYFTVQRRVVPLSSALGVARRLSEVTAQRDKLKEWAEYVVTQIENLYGCPASLKKICAYAKEQLNLYK